MKTKLNIGIITTDINRMDWQKGYIIGFKKANSYYIKTTKDGEVTKDDVDGISTSKGGYGHFHYWKRNKVLETLGGFNFLFKIDTLRYARDKDLYYNNIRGFYAKDDFTRAAQKRFIGLTKRRKRFVNYEELPNLLK